MQWWNVNREESSGVLTPAEAGLVKNIILDPGASRFAICLPGRYRLPVLTKCPWLFQSGFVAVGVKNFDHHELPDGRDTPDSRYALIADKDVRAPSSTFTEYLLLLQPAGRARSVR